MKNFIFALIPFFLSQNVFAGISRDPASVGEKVILLDELINNNLTYSAQEIIRSDLKNGKWIRNYDGYLKQIISDYKQNKT